MDIDFYFDFTSPYSYLAWKKIINSDISVSVKPIMVGSLFSAIGSTGPGEIKAKREYLFLDCLRKARDLEIIMTSPKELPFNPMPFLRTAISLNDDLVKQKEYITFVFEYGWKLGLDYNDLDQFYQNLFEKLGIDKGTHETLENDKNSRRALKLNIKEAVSRGAFGVPTFYCREDIYWGYDSIEFLIKELSSGIDQDILNKLDKFKEATKKI